MRITKIFVSLLLVVLSLNLFAADIVGFWLSEEKDGVIEIYKQDQTYFGKLVWLKDIHDGKVKVPLDKENPDESKRNTPLMGLVNLKDFQKDGDEWTGGAVYDPKNGKTYSAKMWLEDEETLGLRGFIGISLFGRTAKWKRQKSSLPDSYASQD